MRKIGFLLAATLSLTSPLLRAGDGADIKGMRIEPASTKVAVVGKAHLTVDPLTRGDGGLHAPYKVEVSGLPTNGEQGQFTITLSEADFDKLAAARSLNFGGQAVSQDGNTSNVRGTATPSSADAGAIKVKVEGKRGKLVFLTTYQLTR